MSGVCEQACLGVPLPGRPAAGKEVHTTRMLVSDNLLHETFLLGGGEPPKSPTFSLICSSKNNSKNQSINILHFQRQQKNSPGLLLLRALKSGVGDSPAPLGFSPIVC